MWSLKIKHFLGLCASISVYVRVSRLTNVSPRKTVSLPFSSSLLRFLVTIMFPGRKKKKTWRLTHELCIMEEYREPLLALKCHYYSSTFYAYLIIMS